MLPFSLPAGDLKAQGHCFPGFTPSSIARLKRIQPIKNLTHEDVDRTDIDLDHDKNEKCLSVMKI